MCHSNNEKRTKKKKKKKTIAEGIELPNQEKIRTVGENQTYKYSRILEADTIKQEELKEKI